ncbi:MAG: BON domain-containing protein [Nitrospirae bacterium]|nr:MAG: BON domain-containing protein [Nitrospirota bacterium]
MRHRHEGIAVAGVVLVAVLGLAGCPQVLMETAKKTMEDRTTGDQVTDTKIGAGLLSSLADKDKNLLLDVNVDIWEQRAMLTGTVDDPKVRQDVVRLAQADDRIRKIYDEIQIVTKAEKEQRREAAKNKDESKKEGIGQSVNDFWVETKISAKLISTRGVTSVNYRWRSVRNIIYLIGRAGSQDELNTVLEIIRGTEGVKQVKHWVEIKPVVKS